jgi:hypothetical protein
LDGAIAGLTVLEGKYRMQIADGVSIFLAGDSERDHSVRVHIRRRDSAREVECECGVSRHSGGSGR